MSSLLPPNATPVERSLATGGAAIADIPMPIRDIGDPATCPAEVLPFLASERSVDRWEPDWPEARRDRRLIPGAPAQGHGGRHSSRHRAAGLPRCASYPGTR